MAHTEGIWDEDPVLPEQDHDVEGRPIHTSVIGLPMNAYTMGYAHGLMGMGAAHGLEGSSRYLSGYMDGHAQWDYYLSMARGMA